MSPFGAITTSDGGLKVSCRLAGDARLAERHQHLAVRAELEDRVALAVLDLAVGRPRRCRRGRRTAVREDEHAGAESSSTTLPEESNSRIGARSEPRKSWRRSARTPTCSCRRGRSIEADRGAPVAARRQLRPALVRRYGLGAALGSGLTCADNGAAHAKMLATTAPASAPPIGLSNRMTLLP